MSVRHIYTTHTHVRTHRTSSDPAYLHTYVYLYMKREEEECYMLLFPESGPKKNFRVTASLKTTPESGSKKDFRVTASLKRDPTPTLNRS